MTATSIRIEGTGITIIDDIDFTNVTPGIVDIRVERFGRFLIASDENARSLSDVLEDIRNEMVKRGCHDFKSLTPHGGECSIKNVHVSFVGAWKGIRLDLILRGLRAAPSDESPFYTVHKARFAERYNDDLTKPKPAYAVANPSHRDV